MAEPLGTLIAAIQTRWGLSATLAGISGPWFGERPANAQENPDSGTQYPYAIFPDRENRCRLNGMSCGVEIYEHDILIRIYDTSPENCMTQAALVKAIYDSDSLALSLAEGSVVSHRPSGDTRYVREDKNVYYVDVPYDFVTQRARIA